MPVSNLAVQNLVDCKSVPSFSRCPCRDAITVQSGRNAIKGHARGSEFLHVGNDGLFAIRRTIGLPALTAACSGFHALACATELEHDVGFFAL
jgi:hypothetical protein